jgi:hypothetical protein
LFGERPVQAHRAALCIELLLSGGGANQQQCRIARCQPDQEKHEGDNADDDGNAGERAPHQCSKHG